MTSPSHDYWMKQAIASAATLPQFIYDVSKQESISVLYSSANQKKPTS